MWSSRKTEGCCISLCFFWWWLSDEDRLSTNTLSCLPNRWRQQRSNTCWKSHPETKLNLSLYNCKYKYNCNICQKICKLFTHVRLFWVYLISARDLDNLIVVYIWEQLTELSKAQTLPRIRLSVLMSWKGGVEELGQDQDGEHGERILNHVFSVLSWRV